MSPTHDAAELRSVPLPGVNAPVTLVAPMGTTPFESYTPVVSHGSALPTVVSLRSVSLAPAAGADGSGLMSPIHDAPP
ncbi:hypothetical protein ABZZ47_10300 [Streptomyces sp. NPDC006465]|uniref:hypothetical protein n=1 Tax=Streptomyces sp. NPDC006465 TaxID=3157174 RepID=UPI0033B15F3A